jgi:hypothetical protein
VTPALALAAVLGAAPSGAAPCAACIRWELTAAQAARLAAATVRPGGLALLLPPDAADLAPALKARGATAAVRAGLGELEPLPLDDLDAVVLALADPPGGPEQRAFAVKTAATRLRARRPGLLVGVEAAPDVLAGLAAQGAGAYLDFAITAVSTGLVAAGGRWLRSGASAPEAILDATAKAQGTVVAPWPGEGAAEDPPFAIARLRDVLVPSLAVLGDVRVACESAAGGAVPCGGTAFLHEGGDAVVLVRPGGEAVATVVLHAEEPVVSEPPPEPPVATLYEVATARDPPPRVVTALAEGATRVPAPQLGRAFVVQVEGWGRTHARFGAGVDVVAGRDLTVEEILARHQAWALRQRQEVPRFVASGSLVITFQVPGLSAPVTVNADVTLYSAGGGLEVEQRALRLNGLPLPQGGVPRLPILEPERVAAPPLTITLGESYRYRLEGRDRAGGRACYRVAFAPAPGAPPSFRGRAWIDAAEYALVRMDAVQTGLRGAIVSSRQVEELAPVPHRGRTVWLPARTSVHQVYEGPGHRTPIDRVLVLRKHEPDPPDFDARLAAAHSSDAVMLRETPRGFEYLRRASPAEARAAGGATRVPAGRSTAVRTLALGVLVDPAIGDPLPFVGAGYSDLDFLGTGTQLNAFLAGAFAQLAWSAPTLAGSRWRLQLAAFASLVEYNDRVFRRGVEQYAENLRQRPARLSVDLSHPVGPRVRARLGYELSYTRLGRSGLTAADFREPESALAQGLRLALDAEPGRWSGTAWWRPAWRPHWRTWGFADAPEDADAARAYERYGIRLARTFVLSPRLSGRVELAGMAGAGLDRFSRFAFDGFEERLTGYPVGSVRFDRGIVGRSVVVWLVRPRLRLQAWADAARVRDAGFDFEGRTLAGVGAGLETALPFRTLLALEWGHGLQGRDREGREGTHTLRATAYRVF